MYFATTINWLIWSFSGSIIKSKVIVGNLTDCMMRFVDSASSSQESSSTYGR